MRKTKILATLGPSSESKEVIKQLVLAGANAFRLNFSHSNHEEHANRIKLIREVEQELGIYIPIILDTKGPEIRIGNIDPIIIEQGKEFIFSTNQQGIPINLEKIPNEINKGDILLIDDGKLQFKVLEKNDSSLTTVALNNGTLKSRKSIGVTNVSIEMPPITEKDISDVTFGEKMGVDYIAQSFVMKAADIKEMRKLTSAKIIAKIEHKKAIDNIDEIIEEADAIMIARGDLGVNLPIEKIPYYQRLILKKARAKGKPVIVATQMLEALMVGTRPTRPEVSDVANAVLQEADTLMLSGETASGKYPVEAVKTMAKIIEEAEVMLNYYTIEETSTDSINKAVADLSSLLAKKINAKIIATPTSSGTTTLRVSRTRPRANIIALPLDIKLARQLNLVWGVRSLMIEHSSNEMEDYIQEIKQAISSLTNISSGDKIVITAGLPLRKAGTTNMVRVEII